MLTQDDINLLKKEFKKEFATKDDLKSELSHYATKDDLKSELSHYATKEDLKKYATKKDLEEMRDQIIQVIVDQVGTLTSMIGDSSAELKRSREDIDKHEALLTAHEVRIERLEQIV